MKDKASGQSKGCAFVRLASTEAANAVIQALHQKMTMPGATQPLIAKWADAPKPKQSNNMMGMMGRWPSPRAAASSVPRPRCRPPCVACQGARRLTGLEGAAGGGNRRVRAAADHGAADDGPAGRHHPAAAARDAAAAAAVAAVDGRPAAPARHLRPVRFDGRAARVSLRVRARVRLLLAKEILRPNFLLDRQIWALQSLIRA